MAFVLEGRNAERVSPGLVAKESAGMPKISQWLPGGVRRRVAGPEDEELKLSADDTMAEHGLNLEFLIVCNPVCRRCGGFTAIVWAQKADMENRVDGQMCRKRKPVRHWTQLLKHLIRTDR